MVDLLTEFSIVPFIYKMNRCNSFADLFCTLKCFYLFILDSENFFFS